jgi:hypothetical protein
MNSLSFERLADCRRLNCYGCLNTTEEQMKIYLRLLESVRRTCGGAG